MMMGNDDGQTRDELNFKNIWSMFELHIVRILKSTGSVECIKILLILIQCFKIFNFRTDQKN